ncbi:MAG: hypothetical protein ACXVFK_04780 [Solirubrobacteraceae bacterium]
MSHLPRDPRTSRFVSSYSDEELVEILRAVCLTVSPRRPDAVQMGAFDRAKAKSEWPDAPTAAGMRRRFAPIPWAEMLEIVFDSARDLIKSARARTRRPPTEPPDEREAAFFIKLAAARSGEQWDGRPGRYTEVEAQMRGQARRRFRHGSDPDGLLPDRYEIENALAGEAGGGWDRGLQLAGLPPRTGPRGSAEGHTPAAMAAAFLEDVGCLPWSHQALRTYAGQKGEGLAYYSGAIGLVNDDVRRSWPAGRWIPAAAPPPRSPRPIIDVQRAGEPKKPYRLRPDRDEIIEGLAHAYEAIWPETRLKQARLNQLARKHPAIPYAAAVGREAKREPKTTAAALRARGFELARSRRRQEMPVAAD